MLEERERHLAAVHAAIERGIADIDAGRCVRRSGLLTSVKLGTPVWPVTRGNVRVSISEADLGLPPAHPSATGESGEKFMLR